MGFQIVRKGYAPKEVDEHIRTLSQADAQVVSELRLKNSELLAEAVRLKKELEFYRTQERSIADAFVSAHRSAQEIERSAGDVYRNELDNLRQFHARWTLFYRNIIERYPIDDDLTSLGEFMEKMSVLFRDSARFSEIEAGFSQGYKKPAPIRPAEKVITGTPERRGGAEAQYAEETARLAQNRNAAQGDVGFDPVGAIKRYYSGAGKPDSGDKFVKPYAGTQGAEQEGGKKGGRRVVSGLGVSDSGFDFDEALNPTESLDDILKDLI
ncbi:MAG: DivIVA domain-containing protein [Firmicutes bacterium]|nr:DivIVA domain-containing protein [Bacillota bacterium]